MGGILARIYAAGDFYYYDDSYTNDENFNKGAIHKLITIDSPHHGSFIAYLAMQCLTEMRQWARNFVLERARRNNIPLDEGAIPDLSLASAPLRKINEIPIASACHSVVGDFPVNRAEFWNLQGASGEVNKSLTKVGYDTRPFVTDNRSDLIVSVYSQIGGLNSSAVSLHQHDHINFANEEIITRVIELLNASQDSGLFDTTFRK
jgi:hypothetical protein